VAVADGVVAGITRRKRHVVPVKSMNISFGSGDGFAWDGHRGVWLGNPRGDPQAHLAQLRRSFLE